MVTSAILNSSLQIQITLQNWTPDNQGVFLDALVKKGFTLIQPNPMQKMAGQPAPIAHKAKTTGIWIDHLSRRIILQITNENTKPNENIKEILDILSIIGFPSQESVERISIQGSVTIKIDVPASDLVSNIIDTQFKTKANEIFGREVKAIGLRLSTEELPTSGASKSPFVILIEPLFTDDSNSKLIANITYNTSNSESALEYAQALYDRLKQIISGLSG